MTDVGPGQVYRKPSGELMLYVRTEDRREVDGYLCVGARNGVVFTTWTPVRDAELGELVNDTAGRAEAAIFRFEMACMEHEKDALIATMKRAVEWLSPSQAAELRALYFKGLEAAGASYLKQREAEGK